MRRDGEGNVLVRAMVHVSIPVDLVFTPRAVPGSGLCPQSRHREFHRAPGALRPGRAAQRPRSRAGRLPFLDSVLIDGRDCMNPAFQPAEPALRQNEAEGDTDG